MAGKRRQGKADTHDQSMGRGKEPETKDNVKSSVTQPVRTGHSASQSSNAATGSRQSRRRSGSAPTRTRPGMPYDSAFCTLMEVIPWPVIWLVNEVFHENHIGDETLNMGWTDYVMHNASGKQIRRIMDSLFLIVLLAHQHRRRILPALVPAAASQRRGSRQSHDLSTACC